MPGPLLQFPLVAGLQEAHDPKTAPPGTMTRLINAAWTKDGRLDKRDGTKTVGATGAPTSALRLATRGKELLVFDGSNLHAWSPELASWENVGGLPEVALTWDPSLFVSGGMMAADAAVTSDGKLVEAWIQGDPTISATGSGLTFANGNFFVRVTDVKTGLVLEQVNVNDQGAFVRVLVDGTNFAIVYNEAGSIKLLQSDLATTVSLRTDAISATFGYAAFDVCAIGDAIALGWFRSVGNVISVASYDFNGVQLVAPVTVAALETNISAIGLHGTAGENLYFVWGRNGAVKYAVHNPATLAQTLAMTTVDATANANVAHVGVVRRDATHADVAWTSNTTATPSAYIDGATNSCRVSSGGVIDHARGTLFARMLSRPFVANGVTYLFMCDYPQARDFGLPASTGSSGFNTAAHINPFNSSYLVALDGPDYGAPPQEIPHRYVGRIDPLISGVWTRGCAPLPCALSATDAYALVPTLAEASPTPWQYFQGVRRVHVLSGASLPVDLWSSIEMQGETHFAGARLSTYDGAITFDYGFPRACPIANDDAAGGSTTRVNGGGGAMVDGTYGYQTVPVYFSCAGVRHRGPSSPIVKVAVAHGGANDNGVKLAVVPQTLGAKGTFPAAGMQNQTPPVLEIYRTTVGQGTEQKRTVEPDSAYITNIATVSPYLFFTDKSADAALQLDSGAATTMSLAERPAIYSVGELDDYPPVSSVSLRLHRRRLFALSGDHRTIWYSKDYSENIGTAPGFNPGAILVGFDEDLVGMASLDDKFVAGSERAFYVFFGDGPAVNGDGGYDPPTKIATDVGFANARAIVSTPDGIMFQSTRGIHLLTRDLQVVWIGRPVEDTVAAFPVITSAVLVSSKNQVRFTANAADGLTGCVIVYDYVRKQWSKFLYTDTVGAVASSPIADACIWDDLWTFVTPTGVVYTEDSSTALDGGATWVEEDIELSEIDSSGPLGYQRVRRIAMLGDRVSDCDVRMRIAVNGLQAYDQDHTFTSDVVATQGADLVRVVKTQQNTSIRLRVTDAAPTGPGGVVGAGRGVTLSAVGFEIVPLHGIQRRPAKAVA